MMARTDFSAGLEPAYIHEATSWADSDGQDSRTTSVSLRKRTRPEDERLAKPGRHGRYGVPRVSREGHAPARPRGSRPIDRGHWRHADWRGCKGSHHGIDLGIDTEHNAQDSKHLRIDFEHGTQDSEHPTQDSRDSARHLICKLLGDQGTGGLARHRNERA